jgi:O-antigen ligase
LPLLIMNALVLLGLQVRAFWVALIAGMFVWGLVKHQFTRIIGAATALILLLSIAYVFDVSLPATNEGRGEISARNIIGAALAPLDEELASEFTDAADRFSGTTEWRKDWWEGIWLSVNEDPTTSLIGHGYGFPLANVVTFIEGRSDLRTPHNIFFYALGYGGWIGVTLFGLLLIALARLLWRSYRASGDPFGLVVLVMGYAIASFGNYLETPFGAVPFYLLLGLAATPALKSTGAPQAEPSLLAEERALVQAKPQPSKSLPM